MLWVWISLVPALAQVPGSALPGSALPGQVERQFQIPPTPRSQSGETQPPKLDQTVPAEATSIRFVLRELAIDGVTVYSEEALKETYERLLGREVSLAEIYAVAQALTARYRSDGYLLSQVIVPAQEVADGRLRLQAIEGEIARVSLVGDLRHRRLDEAYARKIEAIRPTTIDGLERYLLLMNDLPGAFASATLVPSKLRHGASDLVVQTTDSPWAGSVSVDNRGGRALGPVRFTVDFEQRGALGWGDRSAVRLVGTPNSELRYLALMHDQAVGTEGTRVGVMLSTVRARPDVDMFAIPLDLQTRSNFGAFTVAHPLKRSRAENLTVRGALTMHDGSTDLFGVRTSRDRIRALRFGATYDAADVWNGINIVDVEFAFGLNALGASSRDDPLLSRAGGRPDFRKVSLYAARLQALAPKWSMLMAFSAQHAFNDLLAAELFGVGGEQIGRGYDPSELVGDSGVAVKLELRRTAAVDIGPVSAMTSYAFLDAGRVRQRSPAGLDSAASATSAGVGIRIDAGRRVGGFIEIAKPISRDVAAEGDRSARVYAGLSMHF